jgi:hypothetical protein
VNTVLEKYLRLKKEASFCTFSHSKFKMTVNKKIPYINKKISQEEDVAGFLPVFWIQTVWYGYGSGSYSFPQHCLHSGCHE